MSFPPSWLDWESSNRRKEHIDLLHNATHWLIGREELMGIGPKPVQLYKLNIRKSKVTFVNRLNMFFMSLIKPENREAFAKDDA